MATITLDTYKFVQSLTKSGMPENQARTLADELRNANLESVATKDDITRLELKIEQVEKNILKWAVPILVAQAGLIVALVKFV